MVTLMLPRIFHHIWLGPDPLPTDFAAYRKSWLELHPQWESRLWTEDSLPADLTRAEVYDRTRLPAERADILRLEVLAHQGGVYLDADLECRRPIDELVAGLDFFACYLSEPRAGGKARVGNGIVGAVPGHPILERAVTEVRLSVDGSIDKAATGTVFFTDLLARFPQARIFDRGVFYPLTRAEQRDAYAIHHWARSWKSPEELRASLFRVETRLAEANEELRRLRAELEGRRRRPRWLRRRG